MPRIGTTASTQLRPNIGARHRVVLGLAAEPAEVGRARREVRGRLDDWRLSAAADAVLLVLSELISNAVRHAPSPVIEVTVTAGGDGVLIEVRDASGKRPVVRATAEPYAEGGRGLPLVAALSSAWGWTPGGDGSKITWALVPVITATEGAA